MNGNDPPHASMEPQLEGCGKIYRDDAPEVYVMLQWSRNLRVAERSITKFARSTRPGFNGAAT